MGATFGYYWMDDYSLYFFNFIYDEVNIRASPLGTMQVAQAPSTLAASFFFLKLFF
jgi:hypothetical protein